MDLADPERRLALAYVPTARRPALAALWALDEALARIVATTREPALGQMRLLWWRDALTRLDTAPPPGEPVLEALAREVLPAGIAGAEMAAMTEGWDALLPLDAADETALEAHARERGERLFALSGRLLGGEPGAGAGAGATWARAEVARLHPGTPSFDRTTKEPRWPKTLRPLGMLYVLALRDPTEPQGSPRRILRMLRHRLTGR